MCRRYSYFWGSSIVCVKLAEDIISTFEETVFEKHDLILQAVSFVLKFILFILKTCFLCLHFLAGCFQTFSQPSLCALQYYLDNFGQF